MQVVTAVLAVCCLALGILHLVRLITRPGDRIGEAAHAAMGFGMAAMFSPLGNPVPAAVWIAVFGVVLAWFGTAAARSGSIAGDAGHHVIGSAAMLFMLMGGHAVTSGESGHEGHAAHGGGPVGDLGLTSVVAVVLAAYFAWHVVRCTDKLRIAAPTSATAGPVATLTVPVIARPRTAAVAHLVMAVAMAVMLLGMV